MASSDDVAHSDTLVTGSDRAVVEPAARQVGRALAAADDSATLTDPLAQTQADDERALAAAGDSATLTDPLAQTQANDEPAARDELVPGSRIARFVVEERLGAGAMGVVYAARDPGLDRRIAIKLLHASERRDGLRARLYREAQALARLAHPNVVVVHEVGSHGDQVYVAMELVQGTTLRGWLAASHTTEQILRTVRDAGRGLAAAHAAQLIHRDFKPDNVLIGEDGRPRVTDFGLARVAGDAAADEARPASGGVLALDQALTVTGSLLGTPLYSSPEQLEGRPLGPAADQFSFCVTAYEALYGVLPFHATTLRELIAQVSAGPPTAPPPGRKLPARVHRALLRGMSPAPGDRFPSLDAALAELTVSPPRSRWIAVAAGALVVAGAATGYASLHRPEPTCADEGAAIAQVWNPAVAAALRGRLGKTGRYADRLYASVQTAFDRYATAWTAARTTTCAAQRAGDASAAPKLACLDARRGLFAALIAQSGTRSLLPPKVPGMAHLLEPVETCAHAQPGNDFMYVLHARQELGTYQSAWLQGDHDAARRQIRALFDRVEALGYPPLRAEILLVLSKMGGIDLDAAHAEADLRQALAIAEGTGGDDQTRLNMIANLAIRLADSDQLDAASHVLEPADPVTTRLGGDLALEALIAEARGKIAMKRRSFDEAAKLAEHAMELADQVGVFELDAANVLIQTYGELGREADAEAMLARIRKLVPDAPDPRAVPPSLTRPADAGEPASCVQSLRRAELDRALARCTEDLARTAHDKGAESSQTALQHRLLARVLELRGDDRRSLDEQLAAAAIYEALGVQEELAEAAASAGYALYQLGDPAASAVQYRRSIAAAAALGPPGEPRWVKSRAGLGRALVAVHQDADGIGELEWALPHLEVVPKPEHAIIARAWLALADARWRRARRGDRDRARAAAASAHDAAVAADAALDPRDPLTPLNRKDIARLTAAIKAWQARHR